MHNKLLPRLARDQHGHRDAQSGDHQGCAHDGLLNGWLAAVQQHEAQQCKWCVKITYHSA